MEDTIAAIATAYGEGGIGIIRISGSRSRRILQAIFVPKNEGQMLSRKMTYGHIVDSKNGKKIDEVLAVFMKGPQTYTAEDIAEIHCHGGVVPMRKTLELVLKQGARLAETGEFTKRAFLNGRLDLSQAEAVIDVVKAKTEKGFDLAIDQLGGSLSEKIVPLRTQLLDVLVNTAVNIDYPDEDIEELTYSTLAAELSQVSDDVKTLLDTADVGKVISEGLRVAIVGKPNVGKSSLMNALLQENRAIVTEIPGTTRDTIEEWISIKQIPIKLVDTAGIRETDNQIEKMGIEKSKEAFNRADLIVLVLDGSRPLSEEDHAIMEQIGGRQVIVLINKGDLTQNVTQEEVLGHLPEAGIFSTSLKKHVGLEAVEEGIAALVYGGKVTQNESLLITNARHKALLDKAYQALQDALSMTEKMEALDFIEVDMKNAYESLGEIIGESVSDDILNEVFARFCLGK